MALNKIRHGLTYYRLYQGIYHAILPEDYRREVGRYVSRCILPPDLLNAGRFFVSVGSDFPMIQSHFGVDQALSFTIEPVGGVGMHIPDSRLGVLRMRLQWDVEQLN